MEKEIMISCSFCGKDVPCTKDFEKADKLFHLIGATRRVS